MITKHAFLDDQLVGRAKERGSVWVHWFVSFIQNFKSACFTGTHVAPNHLHTSNFRAYIAGDFSA